MSASNDKTHCPLCRSRQVSYRFTYCGPDPYLERVGIRDFQNRWYACGGCGVLFGSSPGNVEEVYLDDSLYDSRYDLAGMKERHDKIMSLPPERSDNWQRVGRIKSFWEEAGRSGGNGSAAVLDVGAGTGVFLARLVAEMPGFEATAMEINPVAAAFLAQHLHVNTSTLPLSEFPGSRNFDLITFNRVLEHVKNPQALLSQAKRLLSRRGVIYIELPDAVSLQAEGTACPTFSSAHQMVYSPGALGFLLESAGLVPLKLDQAREPSGKWTVFCFCGLPPEQEAPTLQEDEIRPEALKASQAECLAHDIEYLASRRDRFEKGTCPVCAVDNPDLFEKSGFSYKKCGECNMIYMSPRPTEEILSGFYSGSLNYSFFNERIFPASARARREKIFRPRVKKVLELCERYQPGRESLLEIGGGFGIFCEEMRSGDHFREIAAVEATPSLARTLADKGFRVYNDLFERIRFDRKFDVIASFEVIEHIRAPLEHLQKANDILEENGMLVLTFPNCDGFDIATLGSASDSVDHEHLNYFNARSIRLLLERAGFRLLCVETPGQLDVELVRKKILSGEHAPDGFARTVCIDRFGEIGAAFQSFLQENRLSSHMLVAAVRG